MPSPLPPPQGITHHLAVAQEWEAQRHGAAYAPSAFADEGFVHCTDGLERLLVPANAYFRDDQRDFVALEIDLDRVTAPSRYDADPPIYPHVYGPIDTAAVVKVLIADRADDGTFTGFDPT